MKRGRKRTLLTSKHSQLAVFVIIAVVILAIILILFYPRIKTVFVSSSPNVRIEDCLKERIEEAIDIISRKGGSIEPELSIMYKGEEIEYLCYTNKYYETCKMQQPLLRQHIEREIKEYIEPEARECIEDIKSELKRKGYSVSDVAGGGGEEIEVSIVPDNINVAVSGLNIRKETGERYDKFEAGFRTEIYDLIMLTLSILNWEARYGDSDITTYMVYYPDLKVEKYKQSEGSKIYVLTNKNTGESFTFASRSLSWPPGYGFGQPGVL